MLRSGYTLAGKLPKNPIFTETSQSQSSTGPDETFPALSPVFCEILYGNADLWDNCPSQSEIPTLMDGGENEATHLGYKGNWKKKGRENAREGKRVDGLRSGQELHLTGKRGGNFKQGLG